PAVVLPAPFGPRRPNTVASGTSNVTPSSARTVPKLLRRPSTTIALSLTPHPPCHKTPVGCAAPDPRPGASADHLAGDRARHHARDHRVRAGVELGASDPRSVAVQLADPA